MGLSQAEFAEMIGVDQSTVSRLERKNEVRGPLKIVIERLIKEFEIKSEVA